MELAEEPYLAVTAVYTGIYRYGYGGYEFDDESVVQCSLGPDLFFFLFVLVLCTVADRTSDHRYCRCHYASILPNREEATAHALYSELCVQRIVLWPFEA